MSLRLGGGSVTRLERLQGSLQQRLLVTSLVNIRYLTGFESSNAALLVDPKGPVTLFTDFRYIEGAEAVPGVEAVLAKRSLMVDLSKRLRGKLGFESDVLPWSQVETLGSGGLELLPTSGTVEALRAVKDDEEIGHVTRAARAAERAFEALTAETWIGRSERELAWRLRQLMHAHGVDHLSFDTAVAVGLNGSKPHGEPSDTILETRMLVTVDWGARLDGYCSDCTRTLSTGELPPKLREIYEICLEAQLAAVDGIRPGMSGVQADAISRTIIEAAGYGDNFGHGLGHGVGMFIHEAPRLSVESTDTLEVGNVITIEPGIYLPGVGGVRIEDLAVVRDDGVELLTSFPKDLVTVG
jgi:Xaa-Pro aminopeptidase